MSFFRSTLAAIPKATRAYSTSAELRVVGRLVKAELSQFTSGEGGQIFKYTVATENPSSMRKKGPDGQLVYTDNADRTSSFFEVVGFNTSAEYLSKLFERVPAGSLLHVTAQVELKKAFITGTKSERTGNEIQVENINLYHRQVDVLDKFDPEVSEFRRSRREAAAAAGAGQA